MTVFSGGNIAGNVLPDATGRNLGSTTQRWGVFAQTIDVKRIEGIGLNVVSYGADPTGATDSAAALNAALADSTLLGLPLLCEGIFKINSTLNNIDPANNSFVSYKGCTIKAGAAMTNMATIGGSAPPPYNKGFMQGIIWDGNSLAAHGLQLGCSGTSCSTQYVNGYAFIGVQVKNTTGDGVQTGNNVWAVGWTNCGFFNNSGNGFTMNGGDNAGEAICFTNCDFANNSGWGMSIGNPGAGGQSVSFHGCAFDQNLLGQLKIGTSVVNGNHVYLGGCQVEYNSLNSTTRMIQNFGSVTSSGTFFTGGTGNSTYQIDNEGTMVLTGGAISNAGSGTVFNSAQTGITITTEVQQYSPESVISVATSSGSITRLVTLTVQSSSASAISVPNGGISAGGFIVSSTGLKPASGGGQNAITGDGTNVILPATKLGASGTAVTQLKIYTPSLSPSAVAANTTAEQTFSVSGLTTADSILCVNKPTAQAGLGIVGYRVSAADTLAVTFSNNTGSPITPTASETYRVVALRS